MHTLLICPVYPPEPVTSATTTQDLAEGLLQSGHMVTVITAFPNRPEGRLYAGYARRFHQVECPSPGFTIVRVFSTLSPSPTLISRSMQNLTFGLSTLLTPWLRRADVVYGNTWPLIAAGLLALHCRLHKVPLVLNIQDIYPESAIELGKLSRERKTAQWLRRLDAWIARQADCIVTLSLGFANFYREVRKVPEEKITVVPNWLDGEEIKPGHRVGAFREAYGISPDTFIVMYAGNVGSVAGVQTIIQTAALLKDKPRLTFVIAGDGSARLECETLARKIHANNVKFFYPLLRSQVSDVQAAADLLVLPTQPEGALTSVPSKLIAYMLSGRPVLAAVAPHSDTAEILADAQAGVIIPPAAPTAMSIEILNFMEKRHPLERMGENARLYALENFDKKACVSQLIGLMEAAANSSSLHHRAFKFEPRQEQANKGSSRLKMKRVIVLSSPEFCLRRRLVLQSLAAEEVPVYAVVMSSVTDTLIRHFYTLWRRSKRYGLSFWLDSFLPSVLNSAKAYFKRAGGTESSLEPSKMLVRVHSFREEASLTAIRKLSPDLVVLAGVPILPSAVLKIPHLGTLNGHLELIPEFRGNYPVHWSLYKSQPVGVTVHWVDEGIDTGPIIFRKIINPPETARSIDDWILKTEEKAAQLLSQAVRKVINGEINLGTSIPQDLKQGNTYTFMPPNLQKKLKKKQLRGSLS